MHVNTQKLNRFYKIISSFCVNYYNHCINHLASGGKVAQAANLIVTPFSLFLDLVVWITIRQSLCLTNIAVCSIVSESETRIALSIVLVVSPKTTHLHWSMSQSRQLTRKVRELNIKHFVFCVHWADDYVSQFPFTLSLPLAQHSHSLHSSSWLHWWLMRTLGSKIWFWGHSLYVCHIIEQQRGEKVCDKDVR